ncbi:unnamed protein product [Chondrus crispus]|uniref:RING-type domain-containing protein n=1 Tax=Chondrus crispus TaxID=2769 RepID=R7QLH4_CHOCR|nr:unnamed protein product [Chondrus crispus]CDF38618.1 unnamed protein product [Chondrus crispus]|eukprot:XP_005718523.1 unnamed protein product [Chondrus crispus]
MSTEDSPTLDTTVRRRARTNLHSLFTRSRFRHSSRRRHSNLATVPSSDQDRSSVPEDGSFSSFLHRYRPHPPSTPRESPPKPIYIYPGLLRIFRDKAIALDNQCPAVHYKCRECRKDQKTPVADRQVPPENGDSDFGHSAMQIPPLHLIAPQCPHQVSCAICLEEFHGKDLVRKLPCNVNHVFHSKCILDWFISQHRCPLCNESVTNHTRTNQTEIRRVPGTPHRMNADGELLATDTQTDVHAQQPTLSASEISSSQPAARDQSRGQPSAHHRRHETQVSRQKPPPGEKGKKKQRGSRTYSYIVHDSVRMELNRVTPV